MQTIENTYPYEQDVSMIENPFEHRLSDIEELVHAMKSLQVKSEAVLEQECILTEMETLERWVESYRRGLSAARKLSTSGTEILQNIHDKLKLAVEELQRLEDEGGNPANKKQAAQTEELVAALRRFERVVPTIEQTFHTCDHVQEEVKTISENA